MSEDRSDLWAGLGVAACIFALLTGIGSCSYLNQKGQAEILKAGGVQSEWTVSLGDEDE